MGLFSPGWKSRKLDKALACVDRISDNDKLERIIREASEPLVCRKAAERLTDPERIQRLAVDCPNSWVRCALVSKLSDPALLRQIAEKDVSTSVRKAALRQIHDESFLLNHARHVDDTELALVCIQQMEGEDALCQLAATSDGDEIAKACLLRLCVGAHPEAGFMLNALADGGTTEDLLKSFGIDGEAIIQKCLTDLGPRLSPQSIKRLAEGKTATARQFAVPYLEPAERTRCVRREPAAELRAKLTRTLTDAGTLLDIATLDSSPKCRIAALETLRDRKLCAPEHRDALYAVASEDSARGCRDIAYRILAAMRGKLSAGWWTGHIDDDAPDQRLPKLIRASATDAGAATAVARLIVEGKNNGYLYARCGMPVVEALEKMVSGGDVKAAKALHALYTSGSLNPALKGHAEAQKPRFTSKHNDGLVDSGVCGETFTHSDGYSDWSIRPL